MEGGNSPNVPANVPPPRANLPAERDPYRTVGRYPEPVSEGFDLRQFVFNTLRMIYKRKWIILALATAVVAVGTIRTLMQTPLYTAAVRLQIDRHAAKVVEGGNVTPDVGFDFEFLRTQYELLQSRAIAQRIVSALKLGEQPEFLKSRSLSPIGAVTRLLRSGGQDDQASGKAGRELAATNIVLANRLVRPVPGSRMVDISFSDPDPGRAQAIASAYGDAFIASNIDKRFEANSYAKAFLEDQLKQLKLRLEESERAALDFAEKEQIIVVTEKSTIAENNLAAANASLGTLISERIRSEEQWKQARSATVANLPQLLTNAVIDGLRGRRNALVTEYQEKLETFKPEYPAMIQIQRKIGEIDRQLASEIKTIKQSLQAAYESALGQENKMRERIEELRKEVLDLQNRSIRYNTLKREADTNRSLYAGLLQRYKEVDVAGGVGTNNVFVVDRPQRPTSPSSPNLQRSLMLSLLLGLTLGLGVAYVMERLDDRIRTVEDVESISGLATLGIIPHVGNEASMDEEFGDANSAISEAYRSLCTSLQFSTEHGAPRVIFITSAGPSEGKSLTAIAIARYFGALGNQVLLIDADLRKPSLHEKLGHDNSLGLSNYLTGHAEAPDTFQTSMYKNVAFMASGVLPPNAADLVVSKRMHTLLKVGADVFDIIVIDGPPVMGIADAPLLANIAEATVFIVGAGQVRAAQLRDALRRIDFSKGNLIGTVLTKFDAKSAGYGYGSGYAYGGYGYGYGYGRNDKVRPPLTDHSADRNRRDEAA